VSSCRRVVVVNALEIELRARAEDVGVGVVMGLNRKRAEYRLAALAAHEKTPRRVRRRGVKKP
jgi:hypothetical protein